MDSAKRQPIHPMTSERLEQIYEYADLSAYSLKQRLLIRAAGLVFYSVAKLVGRTVRFEIEGWENWEAIERAGHVPIYIIWHNQSFLNIYWWRKRRIVVMTSRSFDGEYLTRFIHRFGYGAVRGSSTRGGATAMVEMIRLMRAGCPTALTPDGPKGPPYLAKMGPVILAKKSGHPMLPMGITPTHYWELPTWDGYQVAKPFTRARLRLGSPIFVPSDANESLLETKREELQRALEELNN
ncbi:MAG: lysophospholipid acyltransferase family protein [Acidobacteriota bacterium]|nr:lysophospholipid acyltransferase family protein [Acidobacteriota bacterium]